MHSIGVLLLIGLTAPCASFLHANSRPVLQLPMRIGRVVACVDEGPPDTPRAAAVAVPVPVSTQDMAINGFLFLILHTITASAAQLAGFEPFNVDDRAAFAAARLASIGAFIAVQQVAPGGMPSDTWLADDEASVNALPRVEGTLNPILFSAGVAVAFALLCLVGSMALAAAQGVPPAEALAAWLPAPKPFQPGRAFDLLVAAPVQEEIFFRAWLIAILARAGISDGAAIGASAILFSLWHVGTSGGNPGELLELLLLGATLGWLYERSGRRLIMPLAAHSTYNGVVVVLGAARQALTGI